MGRFLPCLALFFCIGHVTSQGKDVLEAHMKATSPPTVVGDSVSFPNISHEGETVYPLLIRVSTTSDRTTKRPRTTSTSATTTTSTSTTSPAASSTNQVEDSRRYEVASDAVHSVATRLHHLVEPSGSKNYLVSPFSVALLAGHVLLAARGDSERRLRILLTGLRPPRATPNDEDQRIADLELHYQLGGLLKSLQSQGQGQNASFHLQAGSVFFMNNELKLKSAYQQTVRDLYGSDFLRLNFSGDPGGSLKAVNGWARAHTNGRIPIVYSAPLPRHTAVVLMNAVYFRSTWESPFDPELTSTGVFRLNATHQVKVDNMRGDFELAFVNHQELACRMVVLPYKSPDVNLYAVLPNKDVTDMKEFATKLSSANISTLIREASLHEVKVVIPKMTLSASYSLKEPIMKFKPQQDAREDLEQRIATRFNRRNRTSTTTPTPTTTIPTSTTPTSTSRTTPSTRTTTRPSVKPPRPFPRPPTAGGNKNKPWFDLSGASEDERFRINEILHQVSLEVTEKGTEATAITSSSINYINDGKVFKADRPFLFFIRHEPSLVNLFYAVVMDPTNGDAS